MGQDEMINTLVAMTGGVDCSVLEEGGFKVSAVVEYRPNERRDTTDYTEMTALSALANCAPQVLCNDDIYTLDPNRLASLLGATPISVGHFSLCCTEFSTSKSKKAKRNSEEDMSSTLNMFLPISSIIDSLKIPVIVIENVPGFMGSKDNPIPINDVHELPTLNQRF